ncbi:MAG: rhomboid family intramembrane serine protease [Oscillospiraceae bacterium]|jgi:hypothetical protein|nr:rhomboid family intramembrane serine protease [Oscillospiraceae bacterium]
MSHLRRDANRFLYRNRDKGIPKLMLFVAIGNLLVYFMGKMPGMESLYSLLIFDAQKILQGQVWRLFTYIFTTLSERNFFFGILGLFFYNWAGGLLEDTWGRLRFNLYYLSGILITDVVALLLYVSFRPISTILLNSSAVSSVYLNMSLFLAVATLLPDQRILLYMIIPIKMRWLALFDLAVTLYYVVIGLIDTARIWTEFGAFAGTFLLLLSFFPLLALLNYFLFFGRGVKNLFPRRRYRRTKQRQRVQPEPAAQPNPDWAKKYRSATGEQPYRHKCTVCGRTDTTCPGLEFRYCSRCKGYFCYCIDHINNHNHVQ